MKKLKQSQYYGIGLLVLMLVVFWAVFKVLAPTTFGSPEKLATYMKSALIYAVGGCGLYFICVMGPFDMSESWINLAAAISMSLLKRAIQNC